MFLPQGSPLPEPGDTVVVRTKAGQEREIRVERVAGYSDRGEVVIVPHESSSAGPYCPLTGVLLTRPRRLLRDALEHAQEASLGPWEEKDWMGTGGLWDGEPEYPE